MTNQLEQLIQTVIEKTSSNQLKWDAFSEEAFRVKIGPGFLHLQRETVDFEDDSGRRPVTQYAVQVSDNRGRIVAETQSIQETRNGELSRQFTLLEKLFRVARESALDSNHVIEEMLHALIGK